jgi:DNA invertase Pin-like site-specific DNA recombinase
MKQPSRAGPYARVSTADQQTLPIDVDFVSVTEGLDFSTPTRRIMAGMLGIFAEFERSVLQERVKAGIAHAKAKGVVLGRPAKARAQVDQIRQLLAEGVSKKQIAERFGIGRASVYRAIEALEL